MKLHTIDTGLFKLDGGAMFGVVPKSIWNRLNPADERNLCTWAMRCLLIEEGNRLMLVDTGMGNKQDAKFFSYYDPHGDATLLSSIRAAGYDAADITDVLLTHLHFDHVGGATLRDGEAIRPAFANATYWVHAAHWQWAIHPNPRERASFLKENLMPLQESGQLRFLDEIPLGLDGLTTEFVDGHTEKMTLPLIEAGGKKILFCADLIPSSAHIPLPYVMGYDVRPLLTMDEKARLLDKAAEEQWVLVFEHDPVTEAATVERTEKGVRLKDSGRLADFI